MPTTISPEAVEAIVHGVHGSPCDVLGIHPMGGEKPAVVIRTIQPFADRVELLDSRTGGPLSMRRIHEGGVFEIERPGTTDMIYRFRVTDRTDHSWEIEDPYRFPGIITDFDLYLIGEGTNYRMYKKMGAHILSQAGTDGVHFAVWAPNAVRVSVVGNFNRWDGRTHPMQKCGESGLWELFIPGMRAGDIYKYEILGANGFLGLKTDPYGTASELRPNTASVVWDMERYRWNDGEWMAAREDTDWFAAPLSIYEVHLGSWMREGADNRWLSYRELADRLIPYVKDLGFTHVELLPVMEHPFDRSWGYQTIGYFSPTSRFGTPDDFRFFVDQCHQSGIGVILDWVPAHFPRDAAGLGYFDGTHLYEHADPRLGEQQDWGTYVFNFGRHEVRDFLLSSAVFWADAYHVDGLRVDAVASMLYLDFSRKDGEWIPNRHGGRENLDAVDFLKKFNEVIHKEYPCFLTFAEESTEWTMVSRPVYVGGLGFDFKWNMGWMHDILDYMALDPIYRRYHHKALTFSLVYAFTENFILPFSHDEVVYGKRSMLNKMHGDVWKTFAGLRLLYAYLYAHPGKKLLFMGSEFGQWNEWNHDEGLHWRLLDREEHRRLQHALRTLNRTYRETPALHENDFSWAGFEWIELHENERSILSFERKGASTRDVCVCAFNFTPVPREGYRLGVPRDGAYREIFNSDAESFGGSGVVNTGPMRADPIPWQGKPYSVCVRLPPLGAVYLVPEGG